MVNLVLSGLTVRVMSVMVTPLESPTLKRLGFVLKMSPIGDVSRVIELTARWPSPPRRA